MGGPLLSAGRLKARAPWCCLRYLTDRPPSPSMTMGRTILGTRQTRIKTRQSVVASMSIHCQYMSAHGGGAVDLTDGGESSGPWRTWPDLPGVLGGTYSGHGRTLTPWSAMRSGTLVGTPIHSASGIQIHTALGDGADCRAEAHLTEQS